MKEAPDFECRLCGAREATPVLTDIRDWEFGVHGVYSFYECQACASVQLHPFPDIPALIAAYPDHYIGHVESAQARGWLYKTLFEIKEFFFNRQLQPLVPAGARALDVGCGNGEFLERLRRLGATHVEGIDFSERAVALAARRDIPVFQGVFSDYVSDPARFDVIVMYNYLEHTLNPVEELVKAHSLLKPGGHLIGEVPNFGGWGRQMFGRYWGGNHVPRHTFQFDHRRLPQLMLQAGFRHAHVRQELNPANLALSFQNFFQRHKPDLTHNPAVPYGRAAYHAPLMLVCLPLNAVFAMCRRSGTLTFFATA